MFGINTSLFSEDNGEAFATAGEPVSPGNTAGLVLTASAIISGTTLFPDQVEIRTSTGFSPQFKRVRS